jgi:hypothetical protein
MTRDLARNNFVCLGCLGRGLIVTEVTGEDDSAEAVEVSLPSLRRPGLVAASARPSNPGRGYGHASLRGRERPGLDTSTVAPAGGR